MGSPKVSLPTLMTLVLIVNKVDGGTTGLAIVYVLPKVDLQFWL